MAQGSSTNGYGRGAAPLGNRGAVAASGAPVPSPAQQAPYLPHKTSVRSARRATKPARRPARRHRRPLVSAALWLVVLGVCALMALRTLPTDLANGRIVPEVVSFVPLALIPTIICLAIALLSRRRLLLVVCVLALAINGWWHAGYFAGRARVSSVAEYTVSTSAATDDSYARVMTVNTLNGAASAKQIVEVCRAEHVEVLCLQELTNGMVADLTAAGIDEVLPYHVVSEGASAISNGGRNGIWTAAPQDNVSRNLLPIETSSMPAADIVIGSITVRIVSVHPNSPVRGAEGLWDKGLSVIGSLSDYGHGYLIMGDFNSTWDHARFRTLLGTRFADASQASGEGFHMTYPSNKIVPSLIEIDHIVYARDSGITVSSLKAVEITGTDHKALIGTLEAR